jgi:chemotaxis protein histidine kinase CheA
MNPSMDALRRLDLQLIRQLIDAAGDAAGQAEFRELCADAITEVTERLAQLGGGQATPDHTALVRELHSMRGTLASLGLGGVADALSAMEIRVRTGDRLKPEECTHLRAAVLDSGRDLLAMLSPR